MLSDSNARQTAPSLGESLTMAYRILVVEDEPDTQEMLATLLKLDGHRVETADSGQEGLNLLAGRAPSTGSRARGRPKYLARHSLEPLPILLAVGISGRNVTRLLWPRCGPPASASPSPRSPGLVAPMP